MIYLILKIYFILVIFSLFRLWNLLRRLLLINGVINHILIIYFILIIKIPDIRQKQKSDLTKTQLGRAKQKKARRDKNPGIKVWKQSNTIRLLNLHEISNRQPPSLRHHHPLQHERKLRPMRTIRTRILSNRFLFFTRTRIVKIDKRKGNIFRGPLWRWRFNNLNYDLAWILECAVAWSIPLGFQEGRGNTRLF